MVQAMSLVRYENRTGLQTRNCKSGICTFWIASHIHSLSLLPSSCQRQQVDNFNYSPSAIALITSSFEPTCERRVTVTSRVDDNDVTSSFSHVCIDIG